MNLLITDLNIDITNVPTCIIRNNNMIELYENIVYTASINNNINYLQNITTYLFYTCTVIILLNIVRKIYMCIIQTKIKKLKTIKFKEGHDYTNCTICIEDFELNSNVIILTCEHIYHKKCIYGWINSKTDKNNIRCPNCNKHIYITDEEVSEPLI